MPKDQVKSGHKSLRVRGRVQFAIEFFAGWEGQTDTEYIEAACEAHADTVSKRRGVNAWRRLYHPNPGVRWLRIYLLEDYPLTDDHERRRAWVMQHMPFFYIEGDDAKVVVNVPFAEALWGACDDKDKPFAQLDAFRSTPGEHHAAGRTMVEVLEERGLTPPSWPPPRSR